MRLLIVDDEELTRTGLISSLDWAGLGIEEVIEADNGVRGLEMARLYQPEIILCDVRMPRMDGITMLEKIEKILPDTVAIFMSGYSDKEYLKAAIKLKALNYIEKPLNPAEIREAVLEAKEAYSKNQHLHRGETLHSLETASRLALRFTQPHPEGDTETEHLISQLKVPIQSGSYFCAMIVRLDLTLEPDTFSFNDICQQLRTLLSRHHMDCIYLEKKIQYLVYFIFGAHAPSSKVIAEAADFLGSQFARIGRYSMTAGETVHGISRVYQSYASAVILLQSSFFYPQNTLLTQVLLDESTAPAANILESNIESSFFEALSSLDGDAAGKKLEELKISLVRNSRLLANPVRDLYYRLFLRLEEARRQQQIPTLGNAGSISETIDRCFTFDELHQELADQTAFYFRKSKEISQENPTIFLIRNYIAKNYQRETLSVKDISDHVFLSASYVCTFFKNETGQTLNQYITQYRMEKAKQLLGDARYKISDISSRVGYSDGNYFGKSFKKYTGLSPSEFREKNTQ